MAIILSLYFCIQNSNHCQTRWNRAETAENAKNTPKIKQGDKVLLCTFIQQFFSITIAKIHKQTLIIFLLLNNDSYSRTWGTCGTSTFTLVCMYK